MAYSNYLDMEKIIGYTFSDKALLKKALTHSSVCQFSNESYERLEFLGDRILGLIVADILFSHFITSQEGDLSMRLNYLVSSEVCYKVANNLQIDSFIRVSSDLRQDLGGLVASGIQSDVIESLIAALYLDGGLKVAECFVKKHWTKLALQSGEFRRDAKTELQEWTHAKFGITPVYKLICRSGPDHDPRFKVEVNIPGISSGFGINCSKRAAEQIAATEILKREGIWK
ncbi:ribonuclease III [Candidatus Liberibacter americanus]|uniref:Ribonuclease 3 n=1 Tax=Candidatus Liberibacter americanus str. Sao Paulo TaxID=1261131 RepID=U6B883_9HYPH|nr:ribonuclease III [Candidatus Liberibacter americanus]AHA28076.1 Ribonuclease III [Candidatus Liberibacter americanus str. Sao Paulo]EMS35955.1 ribonuclease III [Candidatus Liberibacter americanus PW_SP]